MVDNNLDNELNKLSLNDKTTSKQRLEDDSEEDEFYDITSDNSNVDSEESSPSLSEHKSLNELNNDNELNLNENKLNKSEDECDEREQGDGEVSYL